MGRAVWPVFNNYEIMNPIDNIWTSGMGDQSAEKLLPTTEQHKHCKNLDIHASSGIRTHDPSITNLIKSAKYLFKI
jgi:hypothetical protein